MVGEVISFTPFPNPGLKGVISFVVCISYADTQIKPHTTQPLISQRLQFKYFAFNIHVPNVLLQVPVVFLLKGVFY